MRKKEIYFILSIVSLVLCILVFMFGGYLKDIKRDQIYEANRALFEQGETLEIDPYQDYSTYTEEEKEVINKTDEVLKPLENMDNTLDNVSIFLFMAAFVSFIMYKQENKEKKTT